MDEFMALPAWADAEQATGLDEAEEAAKMLDQWYFPDAAEDQAEAARLLDAMYFPEAAGAGTSSSSGYLHAAPLTPPRTSPADASCAGAGTSSSSAYWDAEPLTPPGRSPADAIPSWDRWKPFASRCGIDD